MESQSSVDKEKNAISEPEIKADKNRANMAITDAMMLPVVGILKVNCCAILIVASIEGKKHESGSGSKLLIISYTIKRITFMRCTPRMNDKSLTSSAKINKLIQLPKYTIFIHKRIIIFFIFKLLSFLVTLQNQNIFI